MDKPTSQSGTVLLVDDALDNLRVIHDSLQEAGYAVRVATDGFAAIESVRRMPPDVIVLDAMMPGIDGFETCRRLKQSLDTREIPVIFMTGLSDTEHIVQGFQAGGVDYVTKPVVIEELLARLATHVHRAQLMTHTRAAIDSAGRAIVAFDGLQHVTWATPLAQRWLQPLLEDERLPLPLRHWLHGSDAGETPYALWHEGERLLFSLLEPGLLSIQRHASLPEPETLTRWFPLTSREAEVLYWVTLGKTNREIGEILAISPRTVNKHLEHVFEKLGVETRTAAASLVLSRGQS
ncbi:DNA-binding response regulator [Acidihalobacter aeolianus]|uniref:DNA-binding response regulator n=1 Tax=Acidihalobacter aeolianus TaxID=2792603 RepID=A0A1D8K6D8_9GAMM|nr:response regulator transcription factor [Acidihalobacter aeolianus]AOV16523.1 DNA-binding response regulator [Acidihalobacter aeolianus]